MGLASDTKAEIVQILKTAWSKREGQKVPEPEDLALGNEGVELDATVLYADIDGSTSMVDKESKEFAAEVYKCFLRAAARVIVAEGGVITAYDGDRVMAVFIGKTKNTSAVKAALKINAAVTNIINPAVKAQYPSQMFELRHVTGVDTSSLLVARTGVRGANDLVWVGGAANHAAKMSAIASADGRTFISKAVYDTIAEEAKFSSGTNMWTSRTWNGKTIYGSTYHWNLPD